MGAWITGFGAITSLGAEPKTILRRLRQSSPPFQFINGYPVAEVADFDYLAVQRQFGIKHADRGVAFALAASELALKQADVGRHEVVMTIAGSSRGATGSWENSHADFLERKKTRAWSSPSTTAGVFATTVAQAMKCDEGAFTVSAACCTSLYALNMGTALVASGQSDLALVVAAEAANTPFTVAQLQAASIYSRERKQAYPCKPFHPQRTGTILGEGAAAVMLSKKRGRYPFFIRGFGAAIESGTITGISKDGAVLEKAILQACSRAEISSNEIDLIVAHGAGTRQGDAAELAAYHRIFGSQLPCLVVHKWALGHVLAASGLISLILACEAVLSDDFPQTPYWGDLTPSWSWHPKRNVRHILIATLGFGGNACAAVVSFSE